MTCSTWPGRLIGAALLSLLWLSAHAATPWFDGERPSALAQQAVDLLDRAPDHGLDPRDYGAAALRRALGEAAGGPRPTPEAAARLARDLETALQRWLDHLHRGRVDPRRIHHDFAPARPDAFDAAAALRAAVASGRLADAEQAAAPPLPLYGALRQALARYRTLGRHEAWQGPLPQPGGGKLEPGGRYPGLALLARRLQVLGDLAGPAPTVERYEGLLVDAVRAFQSRHGLVVDGVVGRATLAQLAVPPAARARQIELALERLRWTPLFQGPRMIVVNIPEYVLRAYEVQDERIQVRLEMNVIVGRALDRRTPLFDEAMRFIEFSPYWNVPPSIARQETVPRLRRDPAYLEREGFEFVAPDGTVLPGLSAERLDAVLAGRLRIRQRPGPRNALGDIKFVFPNRSNIYLHHTPSTALFERGRRDLSHGCIRVQAPVELARFVLQHAPAWTEARIREAMAAGRSVTHKLAEPVPVLIAYGTSLVKQGRLHFFDDVYGLDAVLDAALRQRHPPATEIDRP